VSVVPDVPAIGRAFDYVVPEKLSGLVRVGTRVRVDLHGRRVAGWVTADGVPPSEGVTPRPIAGVTGWGPPADIVDLAGWAAWRWAGPVTAFLRTASPPMAVRSLPPSRSGPHAHAAGGEGSTPADWMAAAVREPGRTVLRLPPAADPFPVVLAAAALGPALVLAPSLEDAALVGLRLRAAGQAAAVVPREWPVAAAGGVTVVGARAGAWAPVPDLAAVVVLDAHAEAYQEERAPTWDAAVVAAERAARASAPCVAVSPCPTLDLLDGARLVVPPKAVDREGWPVVQVADRRGDDPRSGLYSRALVDLLRAGGRVVCVLNRTGRARLLACAACRELARCERCEAAVEQVADDLRCRRCATVRPVVCQSCGSQRLKALRVGVSRVREELEALAGQPVGEVTGQSAEVPDTAIVVGTEAVLHRVPNASAVAFLDFDQELLAARYRAAEDALALLARAAALVGGRAGGGRLLVQTRLPGHEVIVAAVRADPGRLVGAERARRALLGLPPSAAVALVSGPAADAYAAAVPPPVERLGPDASGRWLLRAPDHRTLCDALAATPRPSGRLRVEVDPRRA